VTTAVRAHDVFCLYPTPHGHVAALRGLTLDLRAGERVVVHGPNGSGKTTLMRVLTGDLPADAGTVDVCGVPLAGAGAAARRRLRLTRLGRIDQDFTATLRPELTVLDNVALQSRLAGARARPARARAAATLDRLGLAHLGGRRPGGLSGGEAQRVCVAAAVAHGPALVLADEPTGELDRAAADDVYDLLAAAAAATGAALLVVTHDTRAVRIADRIVRIRDGRLSEEWAPGEHGSESLVIDDRGWIRLPEPLRRRAGLTSRARPAAVAGGILLRPAPGAAGAEAPEAESTVDRIRAGAETARLRGVALARGGRRLLDGLDLAVPAGSLTVVQGRSGAGKTTLLRVLCGLERPDAGSVTVAGVDLAGLDRAGLAALRRRHVTLAHQDTVLVDPLDVDGNLGLRRHIRGVTGPADDWVERLGLAAVRHRAVHALSGGERQRVAVAAALAARPDLAVLDEPTARQDEAHAELVAAALRAAAGRGVAVVAATHDPVLIAAADAVVTLG
jgi:ABC-type lipoprotein export system ATPase subunit